jgi:hypothetical protein
MPADRLAFAIGSVARISSDASFIAGLERGDVLLLVRGTT